MPEIHPATLHTPRLLLRPLRVGDAQALFEMHSDAKVMRYWSTPPWTSVDAAHAMVAMDLAAMPRGEHLRLGIELVGDGKLVGTCSLFHIVAPSRRAEVGYVLRASAWGHGYMHEALQALLAHAFTTLQLNRLEADVDPRNHASAKTLERLGFVKEGHLRERWIVAGEVSYTSLYGLVQRDWAARL